MTLFKIVVYSDVVCPWCFVGYKRLEKAIALHRKVYPGGSADEFQLTWKPYFLDRDPPLESVPMQGKVDPESTAARPIAHRAAERLAQKFGAARVAAMQTRLTQIGGQEGIQFSFGGRIGDTKPAHVLLQLAGATGGSALQNAAAESLFQAHFEEEQDLTTTQTLVAVGERAGLAGDAIRAALADEKQFAAVVDDERAGRMKEHISGVPHYVINDQFTIGGAQAEAEWMEVFGAVKQQQ
jgi:predicted DsbA family dithiol-disulfide isomerase